MNETKDKYQIEETSCSLSFKPFHHHRKKIKWYLLVILVFVGLAMYCYQLMNETFLIISTAFLIVITWFFLKELLFYIPVRYTFDWSLNAVYQSNFFMQKKIMALDEVIIYKSSEMGSWQYKMGKKKNQFVKSYEISEYFSDKHTKEKSVAYELEILKKIESMITKSSSEIPTNSGGSTFTH